MDQEIDQAPAGEARPADLTHQELMDRIAELIGEFSERLDERSKATDALLDLFAQRLEIYAERLNAGGARFSRIEQLLEEAQANRHAQGRLIDGVVDRVLQLELVRHVEEKIDARAAERADKVRAWLAFMLRHFMPPAAAAAVAISVHERVGAFFGRIWSALFG